MGEHEVLLRSELMSVRTVAGAFAIFRRVVIPPDAPEIQVSEMRKSFYSGVDWGLRRLVHECRSAEADDALLNALLEELQVAAEAMALGEEP